MCCLPINQNSESNKDLEKPKQSGIIEGKLIGVQSTLNGDFYIILAGGKNEVQEVNVSPTMQFDDPMIFYLTHKGRKLYKVFCSYCSVSFWTIAYPSPSPRELFTCGTCKRRNEKLAGEFPYSAM